MAMKEDMEVGAAIIDAHLVEIVKAQDDCSDKVAFWTGLYVSVAGYLDAAIGIEEARKVRLLIEKMDIISHRRSYPRITQ